MKKILILTNHSFMLWQFRRELITALMAEGHSVVIGTPFGDRVEDFRSLGIKMIDTPLHRRGINPVEDAGLLARYFRILRAEKPDLVVTYSIKPNIYAGFACRVLGIPYCANVQGLGTAFQKKSIALLVTRMYRSALKKAKTVFFENTANANLFAQKGIISGEQQCVLSGAGINLEFHTVQPYPERSPVHFLYLGRLMKEKGIGELFEAVRQLHEEGFSFHLDLVGFYEDEYKEAAAQLEQLGIATFHGFQPDPRPYYGACHCVVLPSYHEGMSNVLLEAAATGRPVITSDIPGCREAVIPGESGLLCTVQDTQSLKMAMKQFLSLSSSQRAQMGRAGRSFMESRFDKKTVVEATIRKLLQ